MRFGIAGWIATAALAAGGLALSAAPASAGCTLAKYGELPVTMEGLQAVVQAKVNGKDETFVVDSGAYFSGLRLPEVEKLGLKINNAPEGFFTSGVGGIEDLRFVKTKTFSVAGLSKGEVLFLVGNMQVLGQNIIGLFDTEYDFANGVVRLFDPQCCGAAPLAYWAKSLPVNTLRISTTSPQEPRTLASASLSGVPIRVMFDTGASQSILSLEAAARAGVKPGGPDVVAAEESYGFGRHALDTWIAPFDSFKLGDEEIRHAKLRIGSLRLENADMIIGADFFLSHHVYVSNAQHRLYFTYNGGHVFDLGPTKPDAQTTASAASAPSASSAGPTSSDPSDADGLRRRASAFSARNDFPDAIADLTRAIALAPIDPQLFADRGLAYSRNKQPFLAMADLDQAVKLKPEDVKARVLRGALRLGGHDEAGAKADFDVAEKLDPANPNLQQSIALNYEHAELFEPALVHNDAWLAHTPDNDALMSEALNSRCWTRAPWGRQLDKALADCDAALKRTRRDPAVLDSRGLVKLRLGDVDGALADYDAALKLRPKLAWSRYGRGLAELKKGKTAEGQADLAAAAAIDPELPAKAKRLGVAP